MWGLNEAPQSIRDRFFIFNPAVLGMPPMGPPPAQ
jgi:hypothetical protein